MTALVTRDGGQGTERNKGKEGGGGEQRSRGNQEWPPPLLFRYEFPRSEPGADGPQRPPRHGCLTAWLVVSVALHGLGAPFNCFSYPLAQRALPVFTPLMADT